MMSGFFWSVRIRRKAGLGAGIAADVRDRECAIALM
jgi:hypothetical protein